jgi:hypothetical protein
MHRGLKAGPKVNLKFKKSGEDASFVGYSIAYPSRRYWDSEESPDHNVSYHRYLHSSDGSVPSILPLASVTMNQLEDNRIEYEIVLISNF